MTETGCINNAIFQNIHVEGEVTAPGLVHRTGLDGSLSLLSNSRELMTTGTTTSLFQQEHGKTIYLGFTYGGGETTHIHVGIHNHGKCKVGWKHKLVFTGYPTKGGSSGTGIIKLYSYPTGNSDLEQTFAPGSVVMPLGSPCPSGSETPNQLFSSSSGTNKILTITGDNSGEELFSNGYIDLECVSDGKILATGMFQTGAGDGTGGSIVFSDS